MVREAPIERGDKLENFIVESTQLGAEEIRERAAAGVGLIGVQGVLLRLVGLAANVVLARLLLPEDFGLLAFGLTLMTFGSYVADAGIAAALVRRPEPPTRADLGAFLALQLGISTVFAVAAAALAAPFGEDGLLVAVMMLSLPLVTMRVPGAIVLERSLSYRPLALVAICETLVFYGWSVSTVALGWGVWGVATATVVRAAAASILMAVIAPVGFVLPRPSWRRVRGLLAFGARFQAAGLGLVLREQGLNTATAAIAGLATLGLWSLVTKVLVAPFILFTSLWRVSFPAMARLIEVGEDPGPVIERSVARVCLATGLVLTGLVGSAPALIPLVFGDKWSGAAAAVPWASLGLMVSGPVSVAATGFLYAIGDASTPIRSIVLNSLAFAAVALPLLPWLGVIALGLGWMASALVEAIVLGRAVSRETGARLFPPLVVPLACAATASAAGWVSSSALGQTPTSAMAGVAVAESLYVGALLVLSRPLLRDTAGVTRRVVRASLRRGVATP